MTGSAATLWLAPLLAAAASNGQAGDGRVEVQVIVFNCYTSSAIEVFIDNRQLALTPPEHRNDSIATCYAVWGEVGSRTQVRIHSRSGNRSVDLARSADDRFLLISPDLAPFATFSRDAALLD